MFRSGIMLRIGKNDDIEKQYNEGYLRFSCPANWINYARSQPEGIADKYEAVFAHVAKNDPRLLEESYGDPLSDFMAFWNEDGPDNTVYARYVTSCLAPTICFYSIDVQDVANHFGIPGHSGDWIRVDLIPYYESMHINREESSILVIHSAKQLVEELRREIPKVINSKDDLVKKEFTPENALAVDYVKYNMDINEIFFDPFPYKAIFRKRPLFKEQHEARMVIPFVFFYRHPNVLPKLYKDHELIVPVPGLKNYSDIISASKYKTFLYEFP